MAVLTTMQSTVEKPHATEESDSESSQEGNDDDFDTSVIDEYSVQLQLVYHLLVRNSELSDADMRYYLLGSLHSLCIHCEVLSSGAKKHKKFLRFCQESLVSNLSFAKIHSPQEVSFQSSFFSAHRSTLAAFGIYSFPRSSDDSAPIDSFLPTSRLVMF